MSAMLRTESGHRTRLDPSNFYRSSTQLTYGEAT